MPLPTQAQTCLTNYNSFSGKTLTADQPWASGEVGNTLLSCDLAAVLFLGLKNAASPLTAASFISGVEQINNLPASYGGSISFSSTSHWGYHQVRTVKFDSSCPCWIAQGAFSSLG